MAVSLAGCSDDFAADGASVGETDEGDTAVTGGTADPSGETGADEGPTTGPTGTTATAGSDTDGDTGDPDINRVCAEFDIDCGAGFCEVSDDGAPRCVCDEGYVSIGLGCVSCESLNGPIVLDVPLVDVEFQIKVNGEQPPASVFEDGWILLRNVASDDEVRVGRSSENGGRVTATIIPGTYEIFWERENGGLFVPANRSASIGYLKLDNIGSTEIDVPMVTFAGDFLIDGAPPPQSEFESARIYLRNLRTEDEVFLGETSDGSFQVNVVPGWYEVVYEFEQGGAFVPRNGRHVVTTLWIEDLGDELLFERDIDLQTAQVSGAMLMAGSPFPSSDFEKGRIVFRDVETGDEIVVGETADGDYSAYLLVGSYEVYYRFQQGGALVPVNTNARIDGGQPVSLVESAETVDLDIPVQTVSGSFLVGGAPAPADEGDDGIVSLRNLATGDVVNLGNTHDGTFSRIVVGGTYDVFFAQETPGGTVPANTQGLVEKGLDVSAQPAFDVNVPTAVISGTILLGGSTPPDSEYDDARLYLQNRDTGDSVLLGSTRTAFYSRLVVPGTYDVVYTVETAGAQIPVNSVAVLEEGVVVTEGAAIDIDIPAAQLQGGLTIGGQSPNGSPDERARVFLEDVMTGDSIYLGATWDTAFDQSLAAGRYLVRYRSLESSGMSPANTNAGVACFDLSN